MEWLIQTPMRSDPGEVLFGSINVHQSVQWITGQSAQRKYNDANCKKSDDGMKQANHDEALHSYNSKLVIFTIRWA